MTDDRQTADPDPTPPQAPCENVTTRQRAVAYAVSQALAQSATLEEAAPLLLRTIGEAMGWTAGSLWTVDRRQGVLACGAVWSDPAAVAAFEEATAAFAAVSREMRFPPGVGLPGRIWERGAALWIPDVLEEDDAQGFPRLQWAAAAGLRAAFAFPIRSGGGISAVIEFFGREIRPPDQELLRSVATVGSQIGQFMESKSAETALKESEERKRAILDGALDCIVTIDHEGRVVEFNPAAEKTFGYPRDEALGQEMARLIIPLDFRDRHRAALARHLATGEGSLIGRRIEIMGMRKGGALFPVELTIIRLPSDGPPLFTGFVRDITERKRAEEEMRYVTAQARCLLWHGTVEDTGRGPGTYHWETRVTPDEAAAQAFLPLDLRPGERYTGAWYRHRLPEGKAFTDTLSAEALQADAPHYDAEFGCRGRDGQVRWFEERVYVEPVGPGRWRVVGVATEITERKRAEEEKARLLREAAEAALRQRAFLRDVLFSVTEGKLRLCDDDGDLPAPLAPAREPLALSANTLRLLRRGTQEVAAAQGLAEERWQDLLTAAGEAAMNAVVHAGGGEAWICAGAEGRVQVWVQDHGKGIAMDYLHRATLERGYTTAGTMGHGFWLMLKTADRIFLRTGPQGTTVVLEQDREEPELVWAR